MASQRRARGQQVPVDHIEAAHPLAADPLVRALVACLREIAERRAVVPVLLAESNWSNRQIAVVAGVAERTVRRAAFAAPDRGPVLGADNKVYAPRIVQAVVIDTPPGEEEAMAEPAVARPPARNDHLEDRS